MADNLPASAATDWACLECEVEAELKARLR